MLRAFFLLLMGKKRRKNANVSKATWEYHCPSGKTAKASAICIPPIVSIKPICDEILLK